MATISAGSSPSSRAGIVDRAVRLPPEHLAALLLVERGKRPGATPVPPATTALSGLVQIIGRRQRGGRG